ncbi:unnamed protein product [Rhizoctonia solani]|uniref:Peptidase C14 caspase domain-containing protein n=1 Tax=Rhizoctonia solani TaxID=456999 RepID=A0A8H3B2W9_9AGAM|nr:unnamed protein product [Rhizoctonia solani]
MPSLLSIQSLKRYLQGKLRSKRKPGSAKENALLHTSSPDTGGNKHHVQRKSPLRLYALTIGIDEYSSLKALKGAVSDADDVSNFLMVDLGVPSDHIVNLRNEHATRKRIIDEFQNLWSNPHINRGDPILIYYAGHGGLAEANQEWKERYGAKKIQVIFPYDYGEDTPGTTTVKTNCIPDKTIAQLLNKLAAEKGDNITVIFDSCHSASGNRDEASLKPTKRDRMYRSAEVQHQIPADIDDELVDVMDIQLFLSIKKHRDAELLLNADQSSHNYFAACGAHQKAIEEGGHGLFTSELLKKMRSHGVDNITCHNLLMSLNMPSEQSPQCYGTHKDRILFNSYVTSRNATFIDVEHDRVDDSWVLRAGAASGVTLKSTWELHKSPTKNSESIGRFKVEKLYGSSAILCGSNLPSVNINGNKLYARFIQHDPKDDLMLKVWISSKDQKLLFPGSDRRIGSMDESGIGYKIVSTRGAADVALEVRRPPSGKTATNTAEPEVDFYWYDNASKRYGVEKLEHHKPLIRDEVEVVLFAAAKWRWYLQHTNLDQDENLEMSMVKVATREGDRARRKYLKEPEHVHAEASVVELVVDPTSLHGLKLHNNINLPLYVRMFYFDPADFSIGDMFGQNVANGEGAPNLAPGGQLVIGDGADGGAPVKFNISSSGQVEVGYMKVFWSTEPLELDHVKQKSAFELKPGESRGASKDLDGSESRWGTECLTVALRRGHSS